MIEYLTFGSLEELKFHLNENIGRIDIVAISGTTLWYSDINTRLLKLAEHEHARN